jgi:glucosamine kinase
MLKKPALPLLFRSAQVHQAPRFLVSVDGGGTGTRLQLNNASGQCLGVGRAGPSALGQGVEQAWTHVLQALQGAAAQAGLGRIDPADCAIGLGLSGVTLIEQAQAFITAEPGFAFIALDSDGYTGVLGAHGGGPGAVLVSGTGSVGEALRRDGSRACVGGWGWAIGDEGSGAWLGRCAMAHAHRAFDGREAEAPLTTALIEMAGRSREALLAWCAAAGQQGYASLAPLVFDMAGRDPLASALIGDALLELERVVKALDPEGELPLVLAGSVAERLAPRLPAALRSRCVAAQGDAVAGALQLLQTSMLTMGGGE